MAQLEGNVNALLVEMSCKDKNVGGERGWLQIDFACGKLLGANSMTRMFGVYLAVLMRMIVPGREDILKTCCNTFSDAENPDPVRPEGERYVQNGIRVGSNEHPQPPHGHISPAHVLCMNHVHVPCAMCICYVPAVYAMSWLIISLVSGICRFQSSHTFCVAVIYLRGTITCWSCALALTWLCHKTILFSVPLLGAHSLS